MCRVYEPINRLKEIAIRELDSKEGGFGGYLLTEDLVYVGNRMIVITAIVSRYYEKDNQNVIDEFINECNKVHSSGLGPSSSAHKYNDLLDRLEELLKIFKKD